MVKTAYLAARGFEKELQHELTHISAVHDRLFITDGPRQNSVWAQSIWEDLQIVPIKSIGDAAKILRSHSPWWTHYSFNHHRRCELIQESLPKWKVKPIPFLGPLDDRQFGAFSLLDPQVLIFSHRVSPSIPLGEIEFDENKEIPPSRAYLKLWEVMTIDQVKPEKNQTVIDFGSCPGGWTWVLQSIGCQVISIDKADLDPKIAALPHVRFIKKDAFSLKPKDLGPVDWFFSDIICYPQRLFDLINEWVEVGYCKNFVCTIKFQGKTDFEAIATFQKKWPQARLRHLYHNKHEITLLLQL